jgi:guanine deaminase
VIGQTSIDENWMREALALATESVADGGRPFGAVLVVADEVVGRGRDQSGSCPDPTHHAEIAAIREAASSAGLHALRDGVIYASCEPCVMCSGAILRGGLVAVRFAASREVAVASGYPDVCDASVARLVLRDVSVSRCLADEGDDLLRTSDPRQPPMTSAWP